jgi:phospholipase C
MKSAYRVLFLLLAFTTSAFATVTVTTPTAGTTVTSPVQYFASATTSTCSKGVASMGIYVNNQLVYVVAGVNLSTQIPMAAGAEHTVVEEWDKCGGASYTTINLTVAASTTQPAVTLVANPASITAGQSSVLTVTATNSTGITITGTDGSTASLAATGGTLTVTPGSTTKYTATATGAAGTATATATVTVTPYPAPTVKITANPISVTAGSSSILTVTAANATQVTLTGTDKTTYSLTATGGTEAVIPATTTTYTAAATGPGGKTTSIVTVTVVPNPAPTVTISANPASITSGGSSSLTVTASYATQVTITGSDGTSYTLAGASGGLETVSPTTTTTYTATAKGAGGTTTAATTISVVANPAPTVTIVANPTKVVAGNAATLTIVATNATQVTISGSDGTSYSLASASGGNQAVSPSATTTYTATAAGPDGTITASTTVSVTTATSLHQIDHVIFMLQENHTFDNYFGMLNPYRAANGWNVGDDGITYNVDGIDDKLNTISNVTDEGTAVAPFKFKSTCVDDMSSDWLASFGNVNRYDFSLNRVIKMDGYVHDAEGYAKSCAAGSSCSGVFTDLTGHRSMGYYDQGFLNYYYYMASQFAVSDRWFSPMASKSIDNRIATFAGGTTQGIVKDPGGDDKLPQLNLPNIFKELDQANVSWKIYYTVTQGFCLSDDECGSSAGARWPATDFDTFTYSYLYLNKGTNGVCAAPNQPSSVVGDMGNTFCIDPNHIAPLSAYYEDLTNGTLPSFAFIEAGYANNDEHPGSGQSILAGQAQVAKVVNAFMASSSWNDSVFFLSYDEGGGPYDHVPPVPGHSNDKTSSALGSIPDIASIAVSPDSYFPCLPVGGVPTIHCDLTSGQPGVNPGDAAAIHGFGAQLGFRVPNAIISPFTRRHYVSHTPMDHTAVIKFVENRFIGPSAHLTARDAAQPNLLEFFDFANVPWANPPTPPTPVTNSSLGYNSCTPATM